MANFFTKTFGKHSLFNKQLKYGSFGFLAGLSQQEKDSLIKSYTGLHFIGGGLLNEVTGVTGRDEQREEDRIKGKENFFKAQKVDLTPEKTAMMIETDVDIRNRRRQAVMFGVSQLKVPGPGAASGGGYGGANNSYG